MRLEISRLRPSRARRRFAGFLLALIAALATAACGPEAEAPDVAEEAGPELADSLAAMDAAAREYVALVLELGTHDEGYVDAYYGAAEWRQEAEAAPRTVAEIARRASVLAGEMEDLRVPGSELAPENLAADTAAPPGDADLAELRRAFLAKQLAAVAARARMLEGETMSFDEEAAALYDATPPSFPEEHFAASVAEIGELLPGDGPVIDRYRTWRDRFVIPPDRLEAVFAAAIDECRRRTAEHLELPPDEGFRIEYVRDKPWSGYNWYQGGHQSLIQVNEELPIQIDRAVDLA